MLRTFTKTVQILTLLSFIVGCSVKDPSYNLEGISEVFSESNKILPEPYNRADPTPLNIDWNETSPYAGGLEIHPKWSYKFPKNWFL